VVRRRQRGSRPGGVRRPRTGGLFGATERRERPTVLVAPACRGATAGTTEPPGMTDSGGNEAEAALASPEASGSRDDSTSPSADASPAADAEPGTEAAAGGCIGTPCSKSYDCCPGDSGGPAPCEAYTTNGLNDPCLGGPRRTAESLRSSRHPNPMMEIRASRPDAGLAGTPAPRYLCHGRGESR
jgi:hypothetical protein